MADRNAPTDAEMLAMATAFEMAIPATGDQFAIKKITVEARKQRDGTARWAIMNIGNCLGKDGLWMFESLPSSRTDEFLEMTRWPSPRDALAFARQHFALHPSGWSPEEFEGDEW